MDRRARFENQGYVFVKGLLSPAECARYRAEIQKFSGLNDQDHDKKSFACADGVTRNRPLWPLIYHERLLEFVRELAGPTARYTQHSDIHAHRGSAENEHARNEPRYDRYLRKDLNYQPVDPDLAHILPGCGLFVGVPKPREIAGASVTSDGARV